MSSVSVMTMLTVSVSQVATRFSRAAKQYDEFASIQQRIAADTCNFAGFGSQDEVLDIGCASGRNTAQIARQVTQVTGLDIATGMITEAQRRYPHIPFVQGDAQALPFSNARFSVVYSSMALQWCASPGQVLSEIARVLRPGGRAVLAIMLGGSFSELHQARSAAGLADVVMPLPGAGNWIAAAQAQPFSFRHQCCQAYTDMFDGVVPLLRSISKVGAGSSVTPARAMTRRDLARLEAAWPKAEQGQLPLTYQVLHFTLEKV
ncbi:methyltransferase domain-containing protein [Alteromonas sp. CYL-A6]|uniref:methyltransferase domain-containing protein n=1 Tax=Alteromonas nitratireducens TaxID=3390813 RepID=UPI0034AE8A40